MQSPIKRVSDEIAFCVNINLLFTLHILFLLCMYVCIDLLSELMAVVEYAINSCIINSSALYNTVDKLMPVFNKIG